MKNNLFFVLGVVAVVSVGAACSSSSDGAGGSGGSGGSGGDSSTAGKGGSATGGKGGSSTSGGSGGVTAGGGSGGVTAGGGTGGTSAGGNSGTMPYGTDVKIDDYPKAVPTVACTQLKKCNCPMAEEVMKCVSGRFPLILSGQKALKESIAAGKATFDGAKLAECLNKESALSCEATQAELEALKGCIYLSGKVENGGACTDGRECKEGYCAKPENKCLVKKAIGAVCVDSAECVSSTCAKAAPTDADAKCIAAVPRMPGLCAFFKQ